MHYRGTAPLAIDTFATHWHPAGIYHCDRYQSRSVQSGTEMSGKAGEGWGRNHCHPQVDDTTLEVTELPIRKWTQDYKEFLEGLIRPEEKAGPAVLADYREHHSDADVHFSLQLLPGQMEPALAAGLHSKFKLLSKISCGKLCHFQADVSMDPICTSVSRMRQALPPAIC